MEKQKVDKIITDYLQKIYGFAIKKSYSYDEAEELCSQIIEQAYTSMLKSDEIVNIEGYIWRISQHTYAKYVSSRKKQEGISIDGLQIPYYDKYFFENDKNEELELLRREVAFLAKKRRQVIYEFYYKNKSIAFIAKKLNISEGTVKWHLNKARNELKEGFSMERKIGKLGLNPITALSYGHSGNPGNNDGPESYIGDKLNLNIVYSVYDSPKTLNEIAQELGMTPVYIEDRVNFLEENGFLIKTSKNQYTTYVRFTPKTYSLELNENKSKIQLKIAQKLVDEYVPIIRKAIANMNNVYIPSGNYELFEACAIFFAISDKCGIKSDRDLAKYDIKTTAGGDFIAYVDIESEQRDKDYKKTLNLPSYWACGSMTRWSEKYDGVYSWSIDTRYCSRKGTWKNNLTSDYEYLYEFLKGMLPDTPANSEKYNRLRERNFISEDGKVNIIIVKELSKDFFSKIPALDEKTKESVANDALEFAMLNAKEYPPQMQDLIIANELGGFIGTKVALMVMDILYENNTFKPLTEQEKISSNLIMFCDVLPNQ